MTLSLSKLANCLLVLAASALVTTSGAAAARAQTSQSAIRGTAISAQGGAPIPFALVRLERAGADTTALARLVTDDEGKFRFGGLAAGDYRLRLERIGFEPTPSPVLHVRDRDTLEYALRGSERVVTLVAVRVSADTGCLDGSRLSSDSNLTALWSEARKGIEIRQAFQRRYRYARSLRQDIHLKQRFMPDKNGMRLDTTRFEPDSVDVRERRRAAALREHGWGKPGGLLLTIPDERDLLDSTFLIQHCIERYVEHSDSALVIRFRPLHPRNGRVDIAGAVWLDAQSYLVRRLELEWLDGDRPMGKGSINYSDVSVEGSRLRLPTTGHLEAGTNSRGADADLTFAYWGFQEVQAQPVRSGAH